MMVVAATERKTRRGGVKKRLALCLLGGLALYALGGLAGCSWLSAIGLGSKPPEEAAKPPEKPKEPVEVVREDPFKGGVLAATAHLAPAGSTGQYLAHLAQGLGWEADVRDDLLFRLAVTDKAADKVESRLLGMFYQHGFSVLPAVGDGHQLGQDAVVRAPLNGVRLLVATRERLRLVFLGAVNDVVVIYPLDGEEPQIYALGGGSGLVVRKSRLKQFLD